MQIRHNYKQYAIYPLAILFLLSDISMLTLCTTKLISLTLCIYVIVLLTQNNKAPILFCAFAASLSYFLFHGQIMPFLYALVPISILAQLAHIILSKTILLPYMTITALIATQQLVIEPYIFGYFYSKNYTFFSICGNLIVMTAILFILKSLKFLPKGKLGDRL